VVTRVIIIRGAPANSVAVPVTGVLVTKWNIPLGVNSVTEMGGTEGRVEVCMMDRVK
jgi:hypothetical protein